MAMVAWLAHASCASAPSSPSSTAALDVWGGDHVTVTVASAGTARTNYDRGKHSETHTFFMRLNRPGSTEISRLIVPVAAPARRRTSCTTNHILLIGAEVTPVLRK